MVAIREVGDMVSQVSFLQFDLGYFDRDQDRAEPGSKAFTPAAALTRCLEYRVNHVTGLHPRGNGRP
jgi:hypothetical protein